MEGRVVGSRPKQGLTSAKDLTIKLPEGPMTMNRHILGGCSRYRNTAHRRLVTLLMLEQIKLRKFKYILNSMTSATVILRK